VLLKIILASISSSQLRIVKTLAHLGYNFDQDFRSSSYKFFAFNIIFYMSINL
jgi:hypothetical protein